MSAVRKLTVPDDGNLEVPADLLDALGLQAGDEVIVIQTEDGFFIGSREKVMDQLLTAFDAQWQEDDLSMESFLARRAKYAEDLLKKHYGLTSSDFVS